MSTSLPPGLSHVRTTPIFDVESVPDGLLAAHRVAEGVWGRLVVHSGAVTFVFEDAESSFELIEAGRDLVIPPGRPHHLELVDPTTTFAIEFHRKSTSD